MRADEAAGLAQERAELKKRLMALQGLSEAEADALVEKGDKPQVGAGFLIFQPGMQHSWKRWLGVAVMAVVALWLVLGRSTGG